jgi:tRNA U38,U39,U40 pseudouridine synthase TruA
MYSAPDNRLPEATAPAHATYTNPHGRRPFRTPKTANEKRERFRSSPDIENLMRARTEVTGRHRASCFEEAKPKKSAKPRDIETQR